MGKIQKELDRQPFENMFREEVQEQLTKINIKKWQEKLKLRHYIINVQDISREQVTFPDDISEEDRYFIGVNVEGNIATIFHDREITEEDILHELLHVANPDKSEEWVNLETTKLLTNNQIK